MKKLIVKTKKELIDIIDTYSISNILYEFEMDNILYELKQLTGIDYLIGGRGEYITVNEDYYSDFIKDCKKCADDDTIFFTDSVKQLINRLYKKANFYNNGYCYYEMNEKQYNNFNDWFSGGAMSICDYLLDMYHDQLDNCYNDEYILDFYLINEAPENIQIDNNGCAYTVIDWRRGA